MVFRVLACASLAFAMITAAVRGSRIAPALAETRTRLIRNQSVMIAVVLLIIGSLLTGAGIAEI